MEFLLETHRVFLWSFLSSDGSTLNPKTDSTKNGALHLHYKHHDSIGTYCLRCDNREDGSCHIYVDKISFHVAFWSSFQNLCIYKDVYINFEHLKLIPRLLPYENLKPTREGEKNQQISKKCVFIERFFFNKLLYCPIVKSVNCWDDPEEIEMVNKIFVIWNNWYRSKMIWNNFSQNIKGKNNRLGLVKFNLWCREMLKCACPCLVAPWYFV